MKKNQIAAEVMSPSSQKDSEDDPGKKDKNTMFRGKGTGEEGTSLEEGRTEYRSLQEKAKLGNSRTATRSLPKKKKNIIAVSQGSKVQSTSCTSAQKRSSVKSKGGAIKDDAKNYSDPEAVDHDKNDVSRSAKRGNVEREATQDDDGGYFRRSHRRRRK